MPGPSALSCAIREIGSGGRVLNRIELSNGKCAYRFLGPKTTFGVVSFP
ncbi:MAG: hypothetical protein OSB21_07530 [Myxococcota bacterium]|nr:hypothetical protein [Myxococcota bacterium]